MKKTLIFGILLALFFFRLPAAFASHDVTGYLPASSVMFDQNIQSNWRGAPDSLYASYSSSGNFIGGGFSPFSIGSSTGFHVNEVILELIPNPSGANTGSNKISLLEGDESINCSNTSHAFAGDANGLPITFTNSIQFFTFTPSNCPQLANIANFTKLTTSSPSIIFQTGVGTGYGGAFTADLDAVRIDINYDNFASLAVSNFVASASAQTITFSASGDTTYTQAGEQCKISLYEYDISNPAAPVVVSGGVAYVLLDANNPRTTTLPEGQSTYLGYGFTSTVSTWQADNIVLPYFNAKNTDIRGYTSCYHQTTNADGSLSPPIYDVQQQALNNSSNIGIAYNSSLIATPSALQNAPAYAQPQCTTTDIICQVVQNVQAGLITLFAPNQTVDDADFSSINNAMLSRAPFAYGIAALNTNTSISTVSSTSATSLSFDFSNITGVPIPTKYQHMSYTDTGTIQQNVFAPLRPYEVIILWVLFLLYIVVILRSIFV